MRYECYFTCPSCFDEKCSTHSYAIADFKNGFWVNEDLEFTAGNDCKYWMPPSSIIYIEKIDED